MNSKDIFNWETKECSVRFSVSNVVIVILVQEDE